MGAGRALVEDYFSALQKRDAGTMAGLFAEDATMHEPFYRKELKGPKAISQFAEWYMGEQRYEIVSIKEFNDKVVTRMVVSDELMPEGKHETGTFFIQDGKIKHVHLTAQD